MSLWSIFAVMNRKTLPILLCLGLMIGISAPVDAHHGWSVYNAELRTTMTITRIRWINPHDMVYATDEDGNEWTLLLAPPVRNRRFGFGPGTVEVGDVVEILGAKHPRRFEAKVHTISKDGEEVYRYYYSSSQDSIERLGGTVQEPRERRRD